MTKLNRRAFLIRSTAAAAAAAAFPSVLLPASKTRSSPAGKPKKVVVIGAGLAGLSAAYELVEAGHNVVVVEARTRPGGRVYTIREPFADGLYAEAGAMQCFDNHKWTMRYVKLFGLELDLVQPSEHASILYAQGKRIELKPDREVEWPFELRPDEKSLGRKALLDKYIQPVLSDVRAMGATAAPRGVLADYDRITFSEFLRRQGASPGAITILKLGFVAGLGDGADSVSALNVLRESIHRGEAKHSYTIRGGSDSLPKAFAARLAERIHYGVPVIRIEQDGNGVRVICSQNGSSRTFTGDCLVCAVPFSVLKRIVVSPAFSRQKTAAIDRLEYTSVTRVYLQTRKRFWYDEGLSGNASTDLPVMGIYERTINQPGTRGILESYMAGNQARRVTAMKATERIDAALAGAKMIYPAIIDNFEGGASKCWDDDEWARGAYVWFRPGQMGTLLPHIAPPEGRIHFAGEHASSSPGWMQGALESGNRAAREINDLP